MAKLSPLNSNSKLFEGLTDSLGKSVQQGSLSRELIMFLNQLLTQAATQSDVAASEAHTITDPADTPATVDALRDDLVANTIPNIESKLNALGVEINKVNALIDKLQAAKLME